MKRLPFIALLIITLFSCQNQPDSTKAPTSEATPPATTVALQLTSPEVKLGDYWYQGKAEISYYELEQNRYDAVHPGEAIAIFVTEDFLTDEQVKNDRYSNPNSTPILKLNLLKRFTTGIYDYSIMSSVFTPTKVKEYPKTLKVTNSSQDWCGHTFQQFNYEEAQKQYVSQLYSYFENEGDRKTPFDYVLLEDELLNRIRMNPQSLPTGKMQLLPSATILRLLHLPTRAVEASAEMKAYQGDAFEGENLQAYVLSFPSLNRKMEIIFQQEAPYIIEGWTDTYPSVFDKKPRTTVARRQKTILSPYWQKNGLDDQSLRAELGIQ
jgi:hypothetical protein